MSIETTIYSTLTGYADLTALIGQRVYPSPAGEDATLPLIVYEIIADMPIMNLEGRDSMSNVRIQFSSWARTYGETKAINTQLVNALDTINTCDYTISDNYDSTSKLYRVMTTVSIWQ